MRYNDAVEGKTYTYTYDDNGNILTKTEYAYTLSDELGAATNTTTYGYDSGWKDKLTSVGNKAIAYDNIGNPISYMGATLSWQGRELQTYENDEFFIEYEYDENGMRYRTTVTSKEDNEVGAFDYIWEDQKLISMVFSEGDTQKLAAKYLYNNSGEVIGFQWVSGSDAQPSYYYLKNLQGDITGIVNSSGKMQISYSYDVFGKRTTKHHADSSTMAGIAEMMNQMFIMIINPFGYRGYCYDEYTGLYYLQSRYYDPNTGRFINADDTNYLNVTGTVLSCNLFAYCENDAVNNVDPKGTIAANIVGAVIGAIIGIVGGTFLGNWLADRLALSGNSRTAFVVGVAALVGAAVGTIGYFIGPYVAKIVVKFGQYVAKLVRSGKIAIKKFSSNVKSSLRALFKETCCFVAGTSISTTTGVKPIEKIAVGDLVYAANLETRKIETKKVVNVFSKRTDMLYHIVTLNEEVITTAEHPFWCLGKGWVSASELSADDVLCLQNGETLDIINVYLEILDNPILVYNFEVDDLHNYFVGSSGILVHNKCNLTKINDSYLKKKGLDAHSIKREILGSKAKISLYDLYYDKTTGAIFILEKGANAASKIATYYFIK